MTSGDLGTLQRRIALLGSSGSIGLSTLAVARHWPERFRIEALAVGSKWEILLEQIREFRPSVVAVGDPGAARRLREALASNPAPAALKCSRAWPACASWRGGRAWTWS